jgi:hypothetical protein
VFRRGVPPEFSSGVLARAGSEALEVDAVWNHVTIGIEFGGHLLAHDDDGIALLGAPPTHGTVLTHQVRSPQREHDRPGRLGERVGRDETEVRVYHVEVPRAERPAQYFRIVLQEVRY